MENGETRWLGKAAFFAAGNDSAPCSGPFGGACITGFVCRMAPGLDDHGIMGKRFIRDGIGDNLGNNFENLQGNCSLQTNFKASFKAILH